MWSVIVMTMAALWLTFIAFVLIVGVFAAPRCPACNQKSLVIVSRPGPSILFVDGITTFRCKSCGAKAESVMGTALRQIDETA